MFFIHSASARYNTCFHRHVSLSILISNPISFWKKIIKTKRIKKIYYFDINADWKKKKNACRKFLQLPKIIFRGNVKSNSWWYCMADDDAWWRRWRWPPPPRCQMQLQMTISFFITLHDFLLFITFSFPLFIYSLCNGNNVLSNQQLRKIQYNSDY